MRWRASCGMSRPEYQSFWPSLRGAKRIQVLFLDCFALRFAVGSQ
jgi:hypothetical protein